MTKTSIITSTPSVKGAGGGNSGTVRAPAFDIDDVFVAKKFNDRWFVF